MEELREVIKPATTDVESQVSTNDRPFFTAEVESLIETFASGKKDLKCLPRAEMVDGNNQLFPEDVFVQKLSAMLDKPLKEKAGSRFALLLDLGAITQINDLNRQGLDLYKKTTIVASIGDSRDYCELGLLCFVKEEQQIRYYFVGPSNLVTKDTLDSAFLNVFPGINLQSVYLPTSANKLHASVEICYQAKEFIDNDGFAGNLQEQGKDIGTFVKQYEDELAATFYHTRPMKETFKSNFSYFMAMLAGYLIFAGSRYAETWMVMSKDESLLETSALPVAVMRVMVLMSVRPLESITMLGATAFGAKRYSEIGSLLRAGWAASLILDAISIPILCTSEYWLQSIFKQDAALAKAAGDYLKMYAWAIPPVTASVANNNIFFATNKPEVVTTIELLSVLLGVGFTYTFVFGKLGFKAQGLTGFATSLVIQKWLILAMTNLYLYMTRDSRKYTIMTKSSLNELWQKMKLIFRNGFPLSFQIGSEQLYMFIVAMYAGLYGKIHDAKTLDQANILNEYFTLFSISAGLVIHKTLIQRVGEVRGRDLMLRDKLAPLALIQQNLRNIPQILNANSIISAAYTALVGTMFLFAWRSLISVYTDSSEFNPAERDQISNGMFPMFGILAACTLTEMFGNVMNGALNGLGDVDSPMLRSVLLTVVIGGALGALLCFGLGMGLQGVYLSSLIAYTIGVVALGKTYFSTYNELHDQTADVNTSVIGTACEKIARCFGKSSDTCEQVTELLEESPVTIQQSHTSSNLVSSTWGSVRNYAGSFFNSSRQRSEDRTLLTVVNGERAANDDVAEDEEQSLTAFGSQK